MARTGHLCSLPEHGGTARFRVGVQAPSIRQALSAVARRYPRGVVSVAFPVEPEGFPVYEQIHGAAA